MFKIVLFITLLAYLSTEAYALHYNSNDMHTFFDGQTHGVTVCWWIKGITDSLLYSTLCLVIIASAKQPDARYATLGGLLLVYHLCSLAMYNINYSTFKWGYYILLAIIFVWIVRELWPRSKGKLRAVK